MRSNRTLVRLPMVVGSLAVALTLAACGGSSTSSESTPAASAPAAAEASAEVAAAGIDVGTGIITPNNIDNIAFLFQSSEIYSYTVAEVAGAKQAAADLGVNLDISFLNLDQAVELSTYQQAISSGKYGGIIMQPVTTQLC
jgi:ABC-type sugar transport system substrate-binding protein